MLSTRLHFFVTCRDVVSFANRRVNKDNLRGEHINTAKASSQLTSLSICAGAPSF